VNTADLIGRTITGETSGATAIIENEFKFQIGTNLVTEFILNEDTISGTFQTDEVVRGTADDDADIFIKATVTGIPNATTITNDGTLYTEGETVSVTGGGTSAIINVDAIGRGSLTNFYIDDGGSGYEIGDDIVFNNTDTGGGSAEAKVSVVNGGFTQEDSESTEEDHLVLEDETTRGDPYTGNKLVQESGTGSGDITDIRIVDAGSNYQSLPIVTVDDTNGSGASIFTYGSEIGRIQGLKIVESGAEYQQSPSPPTLTVRSKILVLGKSGNFSATETVTGTGLDSSSITATVVSFDNDRNILTLSDATGTFLPGSTITGDTSGAIATIKISDPATATATVAATANTAGAFINQDGHVSETTMRIQDSLYYQDFSYVIKVGRTINDWRDSFKKTMHTGGFYFTGQVNLQTQVSAQIQSITGINTGIDYEGIALIINTLFSTIFGRRLGTTTDGTTLRANPELGVDPDFSDSTATPLNKNTRDLTLNQVVTLKIPSIAKITVRGDELKYGYAYCGPRMKNINTYWRFLSGGDNPQTSTVGDTPDSTVSTNISPMQMANWANFRLTGLNSTDYDGELVQFGEINTPNLKTYIAFPTEIK
jgi:hypothetical protein